MMKNNAAKKDMTPFFILSEGCHGEKNWNKTNASAARTGMPKPLTEAQRMSRFFIMRVA